MSTIYYYWNLNIFFIMKCQECNGTGEAVYSCCTGQVIIGDILMCPKCKEHLGYETCQLCNGTGESNEEPADKFDFQLNLEKNDN